MLQRDIYACLFMWKRCLICFLPRNYCHWMTILHWHFLFGSFVLSGLINHIISFVLLSWCSLLFLDTQHELSQRPHAFNISTYIFTSIYGCGFLFLKHREKMYTFLFLFFLVKDFSLYTQAKHDVRGPKPMLPSSMKMHLPQS